MNAQHTPTPWRLMPKHNRYIAGRNEAGIDVIIADTGAESVAAHKQRAIDNAAHIVKCVNSHDALVAALRKLRDLAKDSDGSNLPRDEYIVRILTISDAVKEADTALAAAAGEGA